MLMRTDGRLSREGRLLRTAIGLATLLAALFLAPRAFADGPVVPPPTDTYTVEVGDTLWEIARAVAPNDPTDSTVALIMELNSMRGASLSAGSQILVPAP